MMKKGKESLKCTSLLLQLKWMVTLSSMVWNMHDSQKM